MPKVSEIRKWKKEDGWYINPDNGFKVRLGDWVTLGNEVRLGNGVRLGNWAEMPNGLTGMYFALNDFVATVDRDNVHIGCYTKSLDEWLKVTKKQAVKMGLKAEHYEAYKAFGKMVKALKDNGA